MKNRTLVRLIRSTVRLTDLLIIITTPDLFLRQRRKLYAHRRMLQWLLTTKWLGRSNRLHTRLEEELLVLESRIINSQIFFHEDRANVLRRMSPEDRSKYLDQNLPGLVRRRSRFRL